jgi:sec-independent protein translocase protein TatB
MFNVGGGELIVIMLLALIVLGPQRLPTAARQVGKALSELRRLSTGFQNEVRSALEEVDDPDRVAARRNVLAKESRAKEAATDGDRPGRADEMRLSGPPTSRPVRRTPLRAADADATPTNGTEATGGRPDAKQTAAERAPSKAPKPPSS